MTSREKHLNDITNSIASLYLLTALALGAIYLLYGTKPLPPTYAYEKAVQKASQNPHIARLTIPPTIHYGGTGHNSLRKVIHIIELLSKSNTNKGLLIDLMPDTADSAITSKMVSYKILQQALATYKEKTNRKIIVCTRDSPAEEQVFIQVIADHIIDITPHRFFTSLRWPAYQTTEHDPDEEISYQAQSNQHAPDEPIYAGEYKIHNDRKEDERIQKAYTEAIEAGKQKLPSWTLPGRQKKPRPQVHYIDGHIQAITITEEGKSKKVPIVDLTPYALKYSTPAYTPQKRNTHRRTAACFETIMISGDIDATLVKKIGPLIKSAQCDPNIKGTIIIWDSGGGKLLYTQQLLSLLKKLAATKPLVHVAAGECASGAYVLAAATGRLLIAYKNSILGSIGVRSEGALSVLHTNPQLIKRAQEEAKKARQELIQIITENRALILKVAPTKYRQKLDDTQARSYIAYRAQEELLIDKIGTLQDAIDALKRYTGLDLPVHYSANETTQPSLATTHP